VLSIAGSFSPIADIELPIWDLTYDRENDARVGLTRDGDLYFIDRRTAGPARSRHVAAQPRCSPPRSCQRAAHAPATEVLPAISIDEVVQRPAASGAELGAAGVPADPPVVTVDAEFDMRVMFRGGLDVCEHELPLIGRMGGQNQPTTRKRHMCGVLQSSPSSAQIAPRVVGSSVLPVGLRRNDGALNPACGPGTYEAVTQAKLAALADDRRGPTVRLSDGSNRVRRRRRRGRRDRALR
jgi:hypothetical protein